MRNVRPTHSCCNEVVTDCNQRRSAGAKHPEQRLSPREQTVQSVKMIITRRDSLFVVVESAVLDGSVASSKVEEMNSEHFDMRRRAK